MKSSFRLLTLLSGGNIRAKVGAYLRLMDEDERFMHRCLDLAENAWPSCRPNPMVGAVVVNNGEIVSEGFTQDYGGPHAEVMALKGVPPGMNLSNATIYVSLEPCAHFGKTPPCSDAIVASGLGRAVIACRDPFESVDGKGIEKLRNAGVKVVTGVLAEEAEWQNRRFFKFHKEKRPYVVLKWAQTKDGYLDKERNGGQALKVTDTEASQWVHQWRAEEMGILIGGNTLRMDNPRLDVRHVFGQSPIPIVWSKRDEVKGQLAKRKDALLVQNDSLKEVLDELYENGVQSVLVEGGAKVLSNFLGQGLYDEVRRWTSNSEIGSGLAAPEMETHPSFEKTMGTDRLEVWFNTL